MIDIENATKQQLIDEYEKCLNDWNKFSCDCYGFYIGKIHSKIIDMGGFLR